MFQVFKEYLFCRGGGHEQGTACEIQPACGGQRTVGRSPCVWIPEVVRLGNRLHLQTLLAVPRKLTLIIFVVLLSFRYLLLRIRLRWVEGKVRLVVRSVVVFLECRRALNASFTINQFFRHYFIQLQFSLECKNSCN